MKESDIFEAIILGIVQGLTEFLPVSSSAHLIILPWMLSWNGKLLNSLFFNVALHAGTLLAVVIYFRSDIALYIRSAFAILRKMRVESPDEKMVLYFIVSAVPAVLCGFFLKDFIEASLRSPLVVACTLVTVGCFMFASERISKKQRTGVTFRDAVLIGCSQALALVPGVSRSGITISTGILIGLDRGAAARFSFLMAVPVIFGATLLEVKGAWGAINNSDMIVILLGILVSFLSGYLAIGFLLDYIKRYSFDLFVYYRFLLAFLIVTMMVL